MDVGHIETWYVIVIASYLPIKCIHRLTSVEFGARITLQQAESRPPAGRAMETVRPLSTQPDFSPRQTDDYFRIVNNLPTYDRSSEDITTIATLPFNIGLVF